MNLEDIKKQLKSISNHQVFPSVSIFLPVNVADMPGTNEEQTLIKTTFQDALKKLSALEQMPSILEVARRVEKAGENLHIDKFQKGIGIFISIEQEVIVPLPFMVETKIHIGDSFEVRELVNIMGQMEPYMVLVFSEKKLLTLKGSGNHLTVMEVPDMIQSMDDILGHSDDQRFTHIHSDGVGAGPGVNFIQQGIQESNVEKLKLFINRIDSTLLKYLRDEKLRLVLVGGEKNVGHFTSFSKCNDFLLTIIPGNYIHSNVHELEQIVWPAVKDKLDEEKEKVIKELTETSNQFYVAGITEVWRAAAEGRVRTLVVEKDYQVQGVLQEDGYAITVDFIEEGVGNVKEDAVDDLMELVMSKGGNIVVVDNGKLAQHQQIAAITRY